jgi:hypothetical protein
MPNQQAYRLGRTLTAISAVIWFANNFFHSFEATVALIIIGATAFVLLWNGLSE